VDVLADLASTVHFDCFSLEFREFQLNGAAGVRGRDLKLQFKLVSDEVVNAGAYSLPTSAILAGFDLEPIIVLLLI
jgi:hypothetical protein